MLPPHPPHMSTANINQFKKVIAMAGRRQCVFLKPVEHVESILGGLGAVFWWLAVILFSERNAARCTAGTLNSYERWEFSFPLGGTVSYFGKGRNELLSLRSKCNTKQPGFLKDLQFNKLVIVMSSWGPSNPIHALVCEVVASDIWGDLHILKQVSLKLVLFFIRPIWAITVSGKTVEFSHVLRTLHSVLY